MSASVDVPLGDYEFRYAGGSEWYGFEHLFGPDTSYNKAESSFEFRDTGYEVTGYTVTLYKVPHGNLRMTHINAQDF